MVDGRDMRSMFEVLILAIPLSLGCSSSPENNNELDAGSGGASQQQVEGAECNALIDDGTNVSVVGEVCAAPNPIGGTIPDGKYHLVELKDCKDDSSELGSPEPQGSTTLVIAGPEWQFSRTKQNGVLQHWSWNVKPVGTTITGEQTCPSSAPVEHGFLVDGDDIVLLNSASPDLERYRLLP